MMPPLGDERGYLDFEARGDGFLYAEGEKVHIKGVNWFGSESRVGPPLGLDKHEMRWYMEFLRKNKINAIRFLFNHESILRGAKLPAPDEKVWGVGAPWEAPELEHYSYIDMFLKLSQVAAEYGIVVMIACHRLKPDAWPGDGLWYDRRITETAARMSWGMLAKKLCNQWNVFAVDLQNEPHSSSWGKGDMATDWGHAAERLGNFVLAQCPRWLVMVEGIGYAPGAPGADDPGAGYWWGENLGGVRAQPVKLKDMRKLVYSPHTYGPSVYMQSYFKNPSFPKNMEKVWDQHFAFVQKATGQPVVIGEMGGKYVGKDKEWQDWAFNLMKQRGIGVFYFALNPSSKDTGGILESDFTTPQIAKLEALSVLPSTDFLFLRQRYGIASNTLSREQWSPVAPRPIWRAASAPTEKVEVANMYTLAFGPH